MTAIGAKTQLARALRDVVDVAKRSGQLPEADGAEQTKLANEVVDAFDKGEVGVGLTRLSAYAGSPRDERVLERLVDSALQTVGLDLAEAKKGFGDAFQLALQRAEKPELTSPRLNPVRDVFRGITTPFSAKTEAALRRSSLERAAFMGSVDDARKAADPVAAFRQVEASVGTQASDFALMTLIDAYTGHEAWDDVVRVFESAPEAFRSYPIPQWRYALALSLTSKEAAARTVLTRLVSAGDADPATYGLLGRLHKLQADRLEQSGDAAGAAKAKDKAIEAYREGWELDRTEIYPGINVPVLLSEKSDPASQAEAKRTAELVLVNAKRRASTGEDDYWDAAACAEMCFVLGRDQEAQAWIKTAMETRSEPWERKSTVRDIERMMAVRKSRNLSTHGLEAAKVMLTGPSLAKGGAASQVSADPQLSRVLASTYRFEARAPKWLSGNYEFDGIAHDVRMTLADLVYFTRILNAHGIDEEKDVLAASSKMDDAIRGRFGTSEMEDLKSPEHLTYDRRMPSLARMMGASRKDSQTNVSADWINGLGDCRQHAPVKLLMFEAWKSLRAGDLLRQLDEASAAGDESKCKVLKHKLERLNAYEIRILDAEIKDAASQKLMEYHTLTVLVERRAEPLGKRMDELKAVHLADPFYQEKFPLGYGEVDVVPTEKGVKFQVRSELEGGQKIDLVPAPYSFDRGQKAIDYGQLKFRGVEVASAGWERDIPVSGVDLARLHAYADQTADLPRTN